MINRRGKRFRKSPLGTRQKDTGDGNGDEGRGTGFVGLAELGVGTKTVSDGWSGSEGKEGRG